MTRADRPHGGRGTPVAVAAHVASTDRPVAVRVQDLHKRFGDLEVLKGVSLEAREGDVVSMIGASGSGKSTFLRCINFLEMPTAGAIEVTGEQVALSSHKDGNLHPSNRKQLERIRTRLGMVFQSFNLWQHMTVMQNVIEAPVHVLGQSRAEATERAERLLHKVGLYEKRDQYPAFLSGGQQQRAAIARALARIVSQLSTGVCPPIEINRPLVPLAVATASTAGPVATKLTL